MLPLAFCTKPRLRQQVLFPAHQSPRPARSGYPGAPLGPRCHFADELRDKFAGGLRRPVECNPAKHLALRLCPRQAIALPESEICLKQTWVDFINSVRQPIKERDRFKIPLVVWIIDCLFPAPIA